MSAGDGKLYRIHLSEEQRLELKRRASSRKTVPRTRDRLEMVRLSDAGFSVPQIGRHLRICKPQSRIALQNSGKRSDESDFEPVEQPGGPQRNDDAGVPA